MMIAQVLTPWLMEEDNERALLDTLLVNHQGWKWTDITGQPRANISPDPNLYVVEVECDAKTLAAIEADSRFTVLWDDTKRPTSAPSAAEFGLLVAYLGRNGLAASAARAVIGNNPAGRTRAEISATLIAWLATRPKAAVVEDKKPVRLEADRVPLVRIFRWTIPLCSHWTWDHVIEPVVRWWKHDLS